MNILRIFFELFVIYILYKLIVDFIIPVYRTTSQMKNTMSKVQEQMRKQQEQQTQQSRATDIPVQKNKTNSDDYIDYEEIK